MLTGRSTATGTFAGIGGERAWAFEQSKRVGRGELCPEPLLSGYARDAVLEKRRNARTLIYEFQKTSFSLPVHRLRRRVGRSAEIKEPRKRPSDTGAS